LLEFAENPEPEANMTAILSMLAVLATAIWFYRTAESLGLPPLAWAIGGVLIYYGGFLLWMYGVLHPLMGSSFKTHSFWTGIGMDVTSVASGTACMALFRFKVLLKKGGKPFEGPF
jgi:hypothetical protein